MRDYLNPRTLANQKLSTPRCSFTRVEGASQPYCPKWGALEQVHPHYLERDPCLSHPPEGVKAMRHKRLFECLDLGQSEFKIFLYWALWTSLCQFPIRTGRLWKQERPILNVQLPKGCNLKGPTSLALPNYNHWELSRLELVWVWFCNKT
jgi:hypothetical protein